ncbi:3041_t:CDS:2, partial [Racocetra fulgida]
KYFKDKLNNEIINDLIIDQPGLDYGEGGENPVEKITFYDKKENNEQFKLKRDQLSYLVPEQFEELVLRVFVRTNNE